MAGNKQRLSCTAACPKVLLNSSGKLGSKRRHSCTVACTQFVLAKSREAWKQAAPSLYCVYTKVVRAKSSSKLRSKPCCLVLPCTEQCAVLARLSGSLVASGEIIVLRPCTKCLYYRTRVASLETSRAISLLWLAVKFVPKVERQASKQVLPLLY